MTIQKQILDLLISLQQQRGMALVLITHDMGVVAETAQRVQVMYAGPDGRGAADRRRCSPRRAIPTPRRCWMRCPSARWAARRLPTIPGMVPGIDDRPSGCLFNPRCRFATDALRRRAAGAGRPGGRRARCHYPLDDSRPADEARGRPA